MDDLRFKCRCCGSFFHEYHSICSVCWAQGQLLPVPHRSKADMDGQPGVATAREIARMTWWEITQHACPGLKLGAGALVDMEGRPRCRKEYSCCPTGRLSLWARDIGFCGGIYRTQPCIKARTMCDQTPGFLRCHARVGGPRRANGSVGRRYGARDLIRSKKRFGEPMTFAMSLKSCRAWTC